MENIRENQQMPNDFFYILRKLIKSGKMIKKREYKNFQC